MLIVRVTGCELRVAGCVAFEVRSQKLEMEFNNSEFPLLPSDF